MLQPVYQSVGRFSAIPSKAGNESWNIPLILPGDELVGSGKDGKPIRYVTGEVIRVEPPTLLEYKLGTGDGQRHASPQPRERRDHYLFP